MYSEDEFKEIRELLSGERKLTPIEVDTLKSKPDQQYPRYLGRAGLLSVTNPQLFEKISRDESPKKYSIAAFFPALTELFYGPQAVRPQLLVEEGNRGGVLIVRHPTKSMVIKPIQSSYEESIAKKAAELHVGPRQYPSIVNYLTEEFVDGVSFTRLSSDKTGYDKMYELGSRVAEILNKLHENKIYYNDVILSDDLGRSHIMVPEKDPSVLIDYGVAISLQNHPDYSEEEVYNFVRTMPLNSMVLAMASDEIERTRIAKQMIKEIGPEMKRASLEEIFARDASFVHEGMNFAVDRLGTHAIRAFMNGFEAEYQR